MRITLLACLFFVVASALGQDSAKAKRDSLSPAARARTAKEDSARFGVERNGGGYDPVGPLFTPVQERVKRLEAKAARQRLDSVRRISADSVEAAKAKAAKAAKERAAADSLKQAQVEKAKLFSADSLRRLITKKDSAFRAEYQFVLNPSRWSELERGERELEALIEREYGAEQLKQQLLTFPPPVRLQLPPIKGRPFVQRGRPHATRPLWVLGVLLLILTLFAGVRHRYPKDLLDISDSLFNDRALKVGRDSGISNSPSFFFVFPGFCLVAALLVYDYLSFQRVDIGYSGYELFGIALAAVIAFVVIKFLIYRLSAAVFDIDQIIKPHLVFGYVTLSFFTLIGFPFLAFYSLNTPLVASKMVVWIPFLFFVFFSFLYIRSGIFAVSNFHFQKIYLFLYLCAFEICPLIIAFKLLNG